MGPGTEDSAPSAAVRRGPEMHCGNEGKTDRGGGGGCFVRKKWKDLVGTQVRRIKWLDGDRTDACSHRCPPWATVMVHRGPRPRGRGEPSLGHVHTDSLMCLPHA